MLMIRDARLQTRSEAAEVAGMAKYLLANLALACVVMAATKSKGC